MIALWKPDNTFFLILMTHLTDKIFNLNDTKSQSFYIVFLGVSL